MNYFWWIISLFAILIILFITIRVYQEIKTKYLLRNICKRLETSFPDMIVILNDMFNILKIHNFNPRIFPYQKKTLMDVNLWGILSPEVATPVYKAYKEAIKTKSLVTMDLRFEPYEKRKDIALRFFVFQGGKYVVCLIREKE